ncbi:hypothetical protein ACQ86N_15395 [Puia sp. P3]|uniref:hypothetical protein n=1 Tax=Puia sp. P3 TaxID=3423952 RepID=UPI003D66FA49
MKELYARYKEKGLEVIGVSDDDRDSAASGRRPSTRMERASGTTSCAGWTGIRSGST